MKIQMLTLQAGPDGVRQPGSVHDVPAAEAKELIDGGFAIPAAKMKRDETIETAAITKPSQRGKGKGKGKGKAAQTEAPEESDEESADAGQPEG